MFVVGNGVVLATASTQQLIALTVEKIEKGSCAVSCNSRIPRLLLGWQVQRAALPDPSLASTLGKSWSIS